MKAFELTDWLNGQYRCSAAEEWDNVGLLVGDDTREVRKVFLALDATDSVIEQAALWGADMLITHHPMIFGGVKKINNHSFTGRRILALVKNDIVYYAMHTNYDILGMADLSAEYLKLRNPGVLASTSEDGSEGFGRVGALSEPMPLKDFAAFVKEQLCIPDVRVYGDPDRVVKTAAVCTGSGKSMLKDVKKSGADVYVTGDIDYHTGIDAVADGLCIVDAGHYGTEHVFPEAMKKVLSERFPDLEYQCAAWEPPYLLV